MYNPRLKPRLGTPLNKSHRLSKGLVGCWLMNEGGGKTVYDLSGNGHKGTFVNQTTWVSGKYGPATYYDGTDDVIAIPNRIWHDSKFTVVVGLSSADLTATVSALAGSRDTANKGWSVRLEQWNDTGKFGFTVEGVGDYASILDSPTEGICAVSVVDGSLVTYFVNGQFDTDAIGAINNPDTAGLYIGGVGTWGGIDADYKGNIEFVLYYDRALSNSELLQLYRNPFCMFEPTLGPVFFSTPAAEVLEISVYDSLSLTENVTARLTELKISLSDSLEVSESLSAKLTPLKISLYDELTLTEDVTARLSPLKADVYDSLSVSESITVKIRELKISLYDSVTVTDAVTVRISPLKTNVFDSVNVSEDIVIRLTPLKISQFDTLSVSESFTVQRFGGLLAVDIYDSIGVTEAVTARLSPLKVNVADTLSVTDNLVVKTSPLKVSVAENLSVTESVAAMLNPLKVSLYDSLSVSENVTAMIPSLALSILLFDTLMVTDAVSIVRLPDWQLAPKDDGCTWSAPTDAESCTWSRVTGGDNANWSKV